MQALAYVGYFENGRFIASGKPIKIPENKQVIITILDDNHESVSNNSPINVPKKARNIGFLEGPPLPDNFFDPLPEEELELWGL